MNNKQLVVAWIVVIIFTFVAFTATMSDLVRIGSSTLLIGILLIYSLRSKKK